MAEPSVLRFENRDQDPSEINRLRLSPMAMFQPTEFSLHPPADELRYARTSNSMESAVRQRMHSVWMGFEVFLGTHPAHKY
jgi:hypothetical protein